MQELDIKKEFLRRIFIRSSHFHFIMGGKTGNTAAGAGILWDKPAPGGEK
ncbi:hypothetical protein [Hydrogenispora ethanolica]|jgi:hypothetical protein|nr:hypothetical protein [Hydrogenispora ethanolica]